MQKAKENCKLKFNTKGILMIVVFCVVSFGSFAFIYDSAKKKSLDTEAWKQQISKYEKTETPSPVVVLTSGDSEIGAVPEPAKQKLDSQTASSTRVSTAPLIGKIIKEFSDQCLVYSKTMEDWRTHSGIDIAGELGTPIKCAMDGVIEKIYKDDMLGNVVLISHNDGLKTLYANLNESEFMEQNQKIKCGEIIGKIGDSAISEINDGAHLHFEIMKNGICVNPLKFITFS